MIGAEPVRPTTLDRFRERFGPCGFAPAALRPCFGLAESTLMVTGDRTGLAELPPVRKIASSAVAASANAIVGCGRPAKGAVLRLRDEMGDVVSGEVGEIFVGGDSVAGGYWENPEASARTFVYIDGERYVRTGDLGCMLEDELFVVGRLKDVIVKAGEKHFPEDIEATIAGADRRVASNRCAAFGIEGSNGDQLVLAVEIDTAVATDTAEIEIHVRRAILEAHELAVNECVWLRRQQLPRTTSGKVRRGEARRAYLNGGYDRMRARAAVDSAVAHSPSVAEPWIAVMARILADLLREQGVVMPAFPTGSETLADLGVDSLKATLTAAEIAELFGVSINVTRLLGDMTLYEAAGRVVEELRQNLGMVEQARVDALFERLRAEADNVELSHVSGHA